MARSRLLTKDDYWSIWLGTALLVIGLLCAFLGAPDDLRDNNAEADDVLAIEVQKAPFKTVEWYETFDKQKGYKASGSATGKWLKKLTGKPGGWQTNPLDAFITTQAQVDQKRESLIDRYGAAQEEASAAVIRARSAHYPASTKSDPLRRTIRSPGSSV